MGEKHMTDPGTEPDKKPDDPEVDDPESTEDDDVKPEGDPAGALGDAGKRAIDAMKRERNAARKEAAEIRAKLKDIEDKDKSEAQRLQEAAEEARMRASAAEAGFRKMRIAMDKAPEGASLGQIRAVAKRLAGESDEDMEADADELFELLAIASVKPVDKPEDEPAKGNKSLPAKPREKLRGGGAPDDEPDETDPRKLAGLIGRH
jgi:hypothetical protein